MSSKRGSWTAHVTGSFKRDSTTYRNIIFPTCPNHQEDVVEVDSLKQLVEGGREKGIP